VQLNGELPVIVVYNREEVKIMKLIVKQGSVKLNDVVFVEGQTFEIDDTQGKSLLDVGVVEEVQEKAPRAKPKKVKVVEVPEEDKEPAEEVPAEEAEMVVGEPSLDWTRKELVTHAASLGIENADRLGAKEKILEAIQAKKEVKENEHKVD